MAVQMQMKSDSIQSGHAEVYQQFYAQHDLVASVPHVFRRGQSISRGNNTISIKQKLPTRMYGGVVQRRDSGVCIQEIHIYNPDKNSFEKTAATQVVERISLREDFVQDILPKLGYKGGLTINILSEVSRDAGFGFVGAMSALLAGLVLQLSGHIRAEDIEDYEKFVSTSAYRMMILLATMMDASCNSKSPGLHPYTCLSAGSDAFLRINKIELTKEWNRLIHSSDMFAEFVEIEDKIESRLLDELLSLRDVVKLPKQANLTPFDFSIIYLGSPHATKRTQNSYKGFESLYEQANGFIAGLHQRFGHRPDTGSRDLQLDEMSYFLAAHLLQRRTAFIEQPYDAACRKGFVQAINDSGRYHGLIERENQMLVELQYIFGQERGMSSELLGVLPISTAKAGGCMMCVAEFEESRKTMERLLSFLQSNGYPQAKFYYASRRDGADEIGLKTHQYLSQGVYSPFVKSGNVAVMHADGTTEIVDYTKVEDMQYQGIMLDTVKRKLFVNGEKTNHKQLVSQSGTVELFDCLLDRMGEYIKHTELPPSSYTRNKNEMLGKIITPLQTLVKEKFDTDLPIECVGTTYDFQICLKGDGGLLHVIKRLGGV